MHAAPGSVEMLWLEYLDLCVPYCMSWKARFKSLSVRGATENAGVENAGVA